MQWGAVSMTEYTGGKVSFFVSEDPVTLRSCVLKDEGLALRLAAYQVLRNNGNWQ